MDYVEWRNDCEMFHKRLWIVSQDFGWQSGLSLSFQKSLPGIQIVVRSGVVRGIITSVDESGG